MSTKKWDVYVYGDVNIDIVIPGVEKFPEPGQEDEVSVMETFVGGGAALFTLGVGKLGLRPVFQGEVGDDCYGELIRSKFRESHVDDSLLAVSKELKTGISLSFTNAKDRSFLTYRGTNEKISISNVDLEKVKEAAHIHVTGYMGSINHNEGSIAVKDGTLYQAAPYTVEAVDTTGAGDSFNAGFVYGFLRGKTMEECLKCGNGCGALSVTALGGNTGFPTEEKLEAFIRSYEA